jgi:rod shape-determining protein MreD
MRVAVRVAVVLLSAAVLQRGLFAELRVADAAADVFLLLAIAGGIAAGPDRGAVFGFFAGLTLDLLVEAPLGLSALTYCLVGYVVGRLHGSSSRANRMLPSFVAAVFGVVGVVLYAALAEMLGQANALSRNLAAIATVVAVSNALLAPLAVRVVRWAWPQPVAIRPAVR